MAKKRARVITGWRQIARPKAAPRAKAAPALPVPGADAAAEVIALPGEKK